MVSVPKPPAPPGGRHLAIARHPSYVPSPQTPVPSPFFPIPIMAATETDLLAELIERKLECLVKLREMGTRQYEFAKADRMTELLDPLAAKQRVLTRLQRIEQELAPFRGQPPNQRRWRASEQREKCARQLQQCETLLEEIIAQEKRSEAELTRRRDDLAKRLQGMHLASQARGAYRAESQPPAPRLDLACDD